MREIHLVTGNPDKLRELEAVFPSEVGIRLSALDIEEIQGDGDPEKIVGDKLDRAFALLGKPVIVEDVSAELACLNGLPGPFIKYFEKSLGKGALWELARHHEDRSATISCLMGFTDGVEKTIVKGTVQGKVVSPRGKNGFGFDYVFMPDGHERTTAEMSPEEKNAISWRGLAARALAAELFDQPS